MNPAKNPKETRSETLSLGQRLYLLLNAISCLRNTMFSAASAFVPPGLHALMNVLRKQIKKYIIFMCAIIADSH